MIAGAVGVGPSLFRRRALALLGGVGLACGGQAVDALPSSDAALGAGGRGSAPGEPPAGGEGGSAAPGQAGGGNAGGAASGSGGSAGMGAGTAPRAGAPGQGEAAQPAAAAAASGSSAPFAPCGVPIDLGSVLGERSGAIGSVDAFVGCAGEGPDQLFRWTPPASGRYRIDTFASSFDTVLYAGSSVRCDVASVPGQCNDDFGGVQSLLVVDAVQGEELFIVVDSFDASGGEFVLNIEAGGECPAVDLQQALGPAVFQRSSFTESVQPLAEGGVTACRGQPLGVTLGWRAPRMASYRFSTVGAGFDTVLAARLEGCAGASLGCNDDALGTSRSELSLELAEGAFVVLEIGAFSGTSPSVPLGEVVLSIEEAP